VGLDSLPVVGVSRDAEAGSGPEAGGGDCVAFLQWALPRLGRRWAGYRKVRRQVCRRVRRRAEALGLDSLEAYRAHVERHPAEWTELDALMGVTISRFHRDRGVFVFLRSEVMPDLAAEADGVVRAWSAGCAGGEEPYTLAILWELAGPAAAAGIEVLATDVDPTMLHRAAEARYAPSSLRELPPDVRQSAFAREGDELVLLGRFRRRVTFAVHDVRGEPPPGPFDLVLCRYLAFTYFDDAGQRAALARFASAMRPGAALVIGTHEALPETADFVGWNSELGVFRRVTGTG
jgi:chemotaxis protein methyltransferase CheR